MSFLNDYVIPTSIEKQQSVSFLNPEMSSTLDKIYNWRDRLKATARIYTYSVHRAEVKIEAHLSPRLTQSPLGVGSRDTRVVEGGLEIGTREGQVESQFLEAFYF